MISFQKEKYSIEGQDLFKQKLLSSFLHQNISSFELWLVADKTYFFGKMKELEI